VERIEVLAMLRDLANSIRPSFRPASWMMIENGEVVGLCSLVRQPSRHGIDIGYGVSPSRRRLGLASAAVSALLAWSREDGRVRCVRAETSLTNIPSQRVLQNNGFERVGERVDDEDGELICWRADTPN
jgi:RimJ/RimL family protein N-acetyltransferase